jgi:hypothetical protein
MRMKRPSWLFLLLAPSPALADPISIADGGSLDVGSPTNESYYVSDGTLNLLPGALVSSVQGLGPDVSVRMTGGQVTGGISIGRGQLEITGGQSRGYDGPAYGGDGVNIFWTTARIDGGTFTGGDSSGQVGSAVVGSAGTADGVPVLSTLTIHGGTFLGGTGSGGYYGGTTGYSLLSIGNTTVTGGQFLSPIAINASDGGETDFFGTNLSFQDHILSGLLQDGDPIHVQVFGPDGVVNEAGTEVRFLPYSTSTSTPGSGTSTDPSPPRIPEPATGLIFAALAALGLAHRRSVQDRR